MDINTFQYITFIRMRLRAERMKFIDSFFYPERAFADKYYLISDKFIWG